MTADPAFRARTEARNAVARLAGDAGAAMAARTPSGAGEPEPSAGIAAAAALEREARRLCLEHVRRAREDGLSWAQVAVPLGLAGETYGMADSPASRAYSFAVPGYRGISPDWFTWTCPSCRAPVRDYGPGLSPAEAEQGHAAGCGRLAAAVAAWDAQRDEEDERDGG